MNTAWLVWKRCVRLISRASEAKNKRIYLYNVNIMDMSGTSNRVMTYTGLTTTSFTIETINAEMYYYCVQAVCNDGSSKWSEWMDVDIASAINAMSASLSLIGEVRFTTWQAVAYSIFRIAGSTSAKEKIFNALTGSVLTCFVSAFLLDNVMKNLF